MARQGLDAQRQHLLRRLQVGQISRAEYDRQMAALEGGGQPVAGRDTATPHRRDTDAGARPVVQAPPGRPPQFVSMGDRQTAVPVSSAAGVLHEGMRLNKYEIGKKLGHGGMGEVWKARDTIGDRDVVIKVLLDRHQGNETEVNRIRGTFKLVHGLNHTNICPTIDLLEENGVGLCLVIKFLEAITLADYRALFVKRNQTFPASEVVRVIAPCASALDYAHLRKVVHRDIKSENIMIRPDGSEPQIIDFGLAAELRSSISSGNLGKRRQETAGTVSHMAPEQWRSEAVDGKADQYALAVIVYELLTGRFPFLMSSGSIELLKLSVLKDPPPPIPGQPEAINRVLAQALGKQPYERFPTCEAFIQAFAQAAGLVIGGGYRPPPRPPGVGAPAPPLPLHDSTHPPHDSAHAPPPLPRPPSSIGSASGLAGATPLPPGFVPRPPSSAPHSSGPHAAPVAPSSPSHPSWKAPPGSSSGAIPAIRLPQAAKFVDTMKGRIKNRKKLWISLAIIGGLFLLFLIGYFGDPSRSLPASNFGH